MKYNTQVRNALHAELDNLIAMNETFGKEGVEALIIELGEYHTTLPGPRTIADACIEYGFFGDGATDWTVKGRNCQAQHFNTETDQWDFDVDYEVDKAPIKP